MRRAVRFARKFVVFALLFSLLCVPFFYATEGVAEALTEPVFDIPTDTNAVAEHAVERWRAHEFVFTSSKNYADPFLEIEAEAVFRGPNGQVLVMPAFWDGEDIWRVRFAPTALGIWTWETVCSDVQNTGLHGKTGAFLCTPYAGDLEIYKRGFVKTIPKVRYFVYDDGTPFFYLGDTHWSMPSEPFETMFKTIVDTRVTQGFTVYQSEPLGATYNLEDGFSASDLAGFRDLDARFAYIADKGLVHANAQLFFVSLLFEWVHDGKISADTIRRLSRFWVARFSAYPVLWTTAQECDNDFYYGKKGTGQMHYKACENPWKIVAETVGATDPYRHPLSAHMESAGEVDADKSEFKKLDAHTWFAVQWPMRLTMFPKFSLPKSYWARGGGKVAVNYEAHYENLWAKNFGARAQGWISFLNGMYGYGYGAIDIWLYQSTYDTDTTSSDGIDKITPQDKAVPWTESLYFETVAQLSYMKSFLKRAEWQTLTPRFGNPLYYVPGITSAWSVASDKNVRTVAYFFNRTRVTGTLLSLGRGMYYAEWFNPRTGETVSLGEAKPFLGMYAVPAKPDKQDWVFYLHR